MQPLLKQERTKRHWTQTETAKRIGITARGYRHIESGTRNPSFKTIVKMEKVFGKPQSELLVPNLKEDERNDNGRKVGKGHGAVSSNQQ